MSLLSTSCRFFAGTADHRAAAAVCCPIAIVLMIIVVSFCVVGSCQEAPVPIGIQLPILLKVLTFENDLAARVGDEIVIAVLYQSRFRPSLLVMNAWQDSAEETAVSLIAGIPFRTIFIDLSTQPDFGALIRESETDVLFVAPLRAFDLEKIISLSREQKILSMAADPEYVQAGLSIGVESVASRPRIVINRRASIAEGFDLSSQVLKLSRVIDNEGTDS